MLSKPLYHLHEMAIRALYAEVKGRANATGGPLLAGGHCIPIMLPDVACMIWHKLYSSTRGRKDPAKAEKDLVQAATLAAILVEQESVLLRESYREAPRELRNAAHSRLPRLERLLAEHPQARDEFRKLR
ncbi:MAG TPA: GSU2403 family nucleotidyltransferase fold protein [Burkholderiales bacterium]|nr:GSU2403 family nucleotidyltransferase fold protein [Burkholderiales bacterium]